MRTIEEILLPLELSYPYLREGRYPLFRLEWIPACAGTTGKGAKIVLKDYADLPDCLSFSICVIIDSALSCGG